MRKNFYLIIGIILFTLAGCADEIVTEDDFNTEIPANVQLSKFSEIQKQVFTPTCALSGCHGDNNTQANLNLTSGKAYQNLVNVTGVSFPGTRVIPGNKEQSILYTLINSGQMPLNGSKLSQNIIDSIGVWIEKGAPND